MTISTVKAAALPPANAFLPSQSERSTANPGMRLIFFGPRGLRAGWRLLIFLAICAAQIGTAILIRIHFFHGQVLESGGPITATPLMLGGSEAIELVFVLVATLVMGRIERRKFSQYGLPLHAGMRDFWHGAAWGFAAISGTLLAMFLLHGFRITGIALHGPAVIYSACLWIAAFFVVGVFEEFFSRGYMQYTLASGIGFWPAAVALSAFFGLGHAFRPGETIIGAVSAGSFGLLLCLFLKRTGNVWPAIGFHAAYDWGQTFFYGVPNSALLPSGNLFHSTLTGPLWLSGGSVGPEASILCPLALLVVGLIFSRYNRENRYRIDA